MKMGKQAVALPWDNVNFEPSPDGTLRVRNATPLGAYPGRVTERLRHWAEVAPDRVFLASRDGEGWRNATYREAFNAACAIGQALLDRGLSVARPASMPCWLPLRRTTWRLLPSPSIPLRWPSCCLPLVRPEFRKA